MRRSRDLERLRTADRLDLLVVGGGALGAATLRSASLHGLRAALCERHDFGGGTTSRSSRLIHGGLRYLEHGHVRLVAEALIERRVLLDIAPHLVAPLAVHLPIYAGARRGAWKVRAGLWLYDRLARSARLGVSGLLPTNAVPAGLDGLETRGLRGVGRLWDARVREPERLVIETLIDAERLGGLAVNRVALVGLERAATGFVAHLHDRQGDGELRVEARAVVNAAGPWVDAVDRATAVAAPVRLQWVRGSHLLYARWEEAPGEALLCEAGDRRPFFVLPWGDYVVIGTTEEPHDGDPEDAVASRAEVAYLCEAFGAVWPSAAERQPFAAYAGVRALPTGASAHAADRRHRLIAHRPPGIFTLLGGKLTTHRLAGEEAALAVLGFLDHPAEARNVSAHRELPGAQCDAEAFDAGRLAARATIDRRAAERLLERWGCRAWAVATEPEGCAPIPGLGGLSGGEITFAAHHEGAASLEDVLFRRTDAVFAPGLTRAGIAAAAAIWDAATSGDGSVASGGATVDAIVEQLAATYARRLA